MTIPGDIKFTRVGLYISYRLGQKIRFGRKANDVTKFASADETNAKFILRMKLARE